MMNSKNLSKMRLVLYVLSCALPLIFSVVPKLIPADIYSAGFVCVFVAICLVSGAGIVVFCPNR